MTRRIPKRFAPLVYGIIQSGVTTAVASGIATVQALGINRLAFGAWLIAWIMAWAVMLPVVILVSPLIQRAVVRLTIDRKVA